jgi:HK97 family phage portal protein
MVVAHLLLRGNFFALKNRGLNKTSGEIKELIPLAPGIVQEVIQNRDYSLTYKCQLPDGTPKNIPGSEIMHLRGLVMDGFMGLNPIEWLRESIGLAQATQEFGARYFGNGTHPGMIIEKEGPALSAQALANYKASISEAYSGLGKAHRFMLLEEGMKAKSITINPEDAQFLETRNYQRKAIVDIFFTMPLTIICGADSTPTFASAEQFSINFVIYALMPWLVKIEKGIYRDLLTPEERKTYYAKFNAAGLQRGSFAEQMAGFATAIDKEIFNPNECRALLDMNPYDGGEVYKTRTSTTKDNQAAAGGGK